MDVHSLVIIIDSGDTRRAAADLDRLQGAGNRAERATDGLAATFRRAIGPVAAFAGAALSLQKVIDTQRQFDVLNAGLITATGSAESAAVAFEALQDFASKTPYSLDQAVEGFTKLVNLGLTPSEAALMSYGNTASAMGKDLSQMIEAVADAATGEFERLKEFGIKAKQQGDQVSLTFRGVTTTIGNNAAEIERYLTNLGKNEFAGAMEQRMDSLDGAVSNLNDSWDRLYLSISEQGVGSVIEDGVRLATDALEELNAMLASGEMQQYLLAIGSAWGDLGDDARRSMAITADFVSDLFKRTGGDGKTFAGIVFETISVLGVNTFYVLESIGREIGGIAAQLEALSRADFTAFSEIGRQMKADAEAARKEVDRLSESILNPQPGGAATSEYQKHMEEARRLREEWDKARDARQAAGQDRLATFRVGGNTRSRASDGVDRAAAAAEKRRRDEFQSLVESLRTEEEAIAASYAKRRAIIEANTGAGSADRSNLIRRLDADRAEQLKRLEEQRGAELESLRKSLLTEEESIQESYDRRLAIVRANLGEESTLRTDMESRLASERETALKAIDAQRASERDSLYSGLLTQEEEVKRSYERRREAILTSTAVTEMERQDLLRRLDADFNAEMLQASGDFWQKWLVSAETNLQSFDEMSAQVLESATARFGDLFESIIFDAGSAEEAIYKLADGMLRSTVNALGQMAAQWLAYQAVQAAVGGSGAAAAVAGKTAEAQMQVAMAGLNAFTSTAAIPIVGPGLAPGAAAAAIAATEPLAASVAALAASAAATKFAGAFDTGGRIPAGKIGLVGEYGPEFVRGPANVTSRKDTAKMLEQQARPQAAPEPNVNLRINNILDPSLVGDYLATDEGEQLVMNIVQRNKTGLGY